MHIVIHRNINDPAVSTTEVKKVLADAGIKVSRVDLITKEPGPYRSAL